LLLLLLKRVIWLWELYTPLMPLRLLTELLMFSQHMNRIRLRNVICQQLLPKKGGGRIPACEILNITPAAANLIRKNKVDQLYTVIETGSSMGMRSMRQDLQRLVERDLVYWKDALARAEKYTEDFREWLERQGYK